MYQILLQNDDLIEKQRYNLFMKYARLYENDDNKQNGNDYKDIELLIYDEVNEYFEEKVYSTSGKEIGTLEGSIQIKNIPVLTQIISGVHTENGYLSSSCVGIDSGCQVLMSKEFLPEELKIIIHNCTILFSNSEQNNYRLTDILKKIKVELKKSVKEKVLFYEYCSNIELLMKGQCTLIDMGRNLLTMITNLSKANRDLVFEIINLILIRGELDLERMTIIIDQKYPNFPNVCEKFISLLNEVLEVSIVNLGLDVTDSTTKNFVETNLAILYFRIPNVNIINNILI